MIGEWLKCSKCKSDMFVPEALNTAALRAKGRINFYCPYGHPQIYVEGETEEVKLRRERDRLAQQIAQRDDEISGLRKSWDDAEKRAAAKHRRLFR